MQRYVKFGLALVILTGIGIATVSALLLKTKKNKVSSYSKSKATGIRIDEDLTSSSLTESGSSDELHLPSPPCNDLESSISESDDYYSASAYSSDESTDETQTSVTDSSSSTTAVSDVTTTISMDTTLTDPSHEDVAQHNQDMKETVQAIVASTVTNCPVASSSETFYDSLSSPIVLTLGNQNNGNSTSLTNFRYEPQRSPVQRSPVVREYSRVQDSPGSSHFETNFQGMYDSYNSIVPPLMPNTGPIIFNFPAGQEEQIRVDSNLNQTNLTPQYTTSDVSETKNPELNSEQSYLNDVE